MDFTLLKELTEAIGPPGYEEPVRAILQRYLAGKVDQMFTDAMGNLIVKQGDGPIRLMLDAHMDEVGLLISRVTDDGFLQFKLTGGIDARTLPGRRYWIGPNRVPGVIGLKAFHLTEDREVTVPARELFIDIGARSRAEALAVVEYGDPAVWATETERLGPRVIKGKAMDDRAGCALLAEALLTARRPELTVYGLFSTQEEIDGRGAQVAAYHLQPDLALVLECTSCHDLPGVEGAERSVELGRGPALSWMDGYTIVPERFNRHLLDLAQRHGIPVQMRRLTTAGTDAGAIHPARAGVPTANLSLPGRYIHSNAALIDSGDYDAALALVQRLIESVARGEFRP